MSDDECPPIKRKQSINNIIEYDEEFPPMVDKISDYLPKLQKCNAEELMVGDEYYIRNFGYYKEKITDIDEPNFICYNYRWKKCRKLQIKSVWTIFKILPPTYEEPILK